MTQTHTTRDTLAIAAKLVEVMKRDKRAKSQFGESLNDQARRRILIAALKQVLVSA
jgi:hypothetical protein